MAKLLAYDTDARDALSEGLTKLARAVKSTLGPRGHNAVLDKGWGAPTITKDGVTVAEEIDLHDKYENMAAQMVKEVAKKTSDVAGDGTTTATVLAEAIFINGMRHVTSGANPAALKRGVDRAVEAVVDELRGNARPVDGRGDVADIATIAANGDAEIGKMIADAMEKVGKDGVITVEDGKSLDTSVDVTEGMQFDRGFLSPHFVTDQDRMEAELDNPLILVHEDKISAVHKIVPLAEKVAKAKKKLVIIAENVEGEALATLVVNKLRGIIDVCAVKAPGYGDRRRQMLLDIAAVTGAKAYMKDLGEDLENVDLNDLGTAKKVRVDKDDTVIVSGGGDHKDVKARVEQIRREMESTTSSYDKEKLQERLAKLTGGVAQIKLGAATEAEMKEKKARVEDALAATRAAVEEGVVPGGGTALLRASAAADAGKLKLKGDEAEGARIVQEACRAPIRQIADNAGFEGRVVANRVLAEKSSTHGFDAAKGEYGDLVEAGVIDPVKVTRSALQNAASVATVMLMCDCLVAIKPEKPSAQGAGMEDMDY